MSESGFDRFMSRALPGYASWRGPDPVGGVLRSVVTIACWIALFRVSGWTWFLAPPLICVLAYLYAYSRGHRVESHSAGTPATNAAGPPGNDDRVDLSMIGQTHFGQGVTARGTPTEGYYRLVVTERFLDANSVVYIHEMGEDAPLEGTIQVGHLQLRFINALAGD